MPTPTLEQPGASAVLDVPALIFAMTFPTVMAWIYFMVLPNGAAENNPGLKTAFFLGKAIQFAFPLAFVLFTDRRQLWPAPFSWRGMGPAIGFGLATTTAMLLLYFPVLKPTGLFDVTADKVRHWLAQLNLSTTAGFLLMAGLVSLVHSLAEEYYWRWFVFGWLQRWLPWGWAAVISGLAFMGHHVIVLAYYFPEHFWTVAVPFSVGVGVGGVVWAWIYRWSGSIYAVWVSHCLIDLGIMVVGYDLLIPHFESMPFRQP